MSVDSPGKSKALKSRLANMTSAPNSKKKKELEVAAMYPVFLLLRDVFQMNPESH